MRRFALFVPVLLASNSISNSLAKGSSNLLFRSNQNFFINLVRQPICKMSTNKNEEVKRQKEFYDSITLDEKRKLYACGNKFIKLSEIPRWSESNEQTDDQAQSTYKSDSKLNEKVSLFKADITALEIDAIVNAANSRLAGGGGVDGAIHSAAGRQLLLNECGLAGGLPTGNSLLTSGYKLPAKRIIHTVGPVGEKPDLLKACYENSLNLAKHNSLRTLAFPCISTGVYGYPNEKAAHVALKAVRDWLEINADTIDCVIFCVFLPVDVEIYKKLLPVYFPK